MGTVGRRRRMVCDAVNLLRKVFVGVLDTRIRGMSAICGDIMLLVGGAELIPNICRMVYMCIRFILNRLVRICRVRLLLN